MILRPAAAGDARAVATLWNCMIRDTLATFTTVEKSPEVVEALMAQRPDAFWVAEDKKLLGFITYGPFRDGLGYAATVEHSIILAPSAQRKGVGRALMRHAMQAAEDQGYRVMVAGISSANPGAIAFHASLGFTKTGHMPDVGRKNGHWLDLILMQKTLQSP